MKLIHMAKNSLMHRDKQKNFQQGGLNMSKANNQMETIGIDPVSGNEVPLGSTPEGVRDDIDVKISRGEMVIPEYAVNYHGVERYIDSIQKAQEGYQQMQDMGLMGNPDEAIMDESEPLPKMEEEEDVPEYQFGGLATTQLPSLPPITPPTSSIVPSANVIQPLRPVSLQPTPVAPQGGQFVQPFNVGNIEDFSSSTLTAGDYKIIPYINSAGNTIYVANVNGQIQGDIPAGYFPATQEQVDVSQQLSQVQSAIPKVPAQFAGGPPSSVTGSGGGGGVSVSGAPSVSTPTLSPQAVATAAQISATKAPNVNAPPPQARAASLTPPKTSTLVSQIQPPSLAQNIAGLATDTPSADLTEGRLPFGVTISSSDLAQTGLSFAASQISNALGLTTPTNIFSPLSSIAGLSLNPVSVALGIANAVVNAPSQPNIAMAQSIAGIPNTGVDPLTGFSFHAVQPTSFLQKAISLITDEPIMAVYNYMDPSMAPMGIMAALTGPMALAHNADLTNMTPSEIIAAFNSNTQSGRLSYSGPLGIPTTEGSYMSDGSFLSKYGKSAMGTKNSFKSLSDINQAIVATNKSKNDILGLNSINPDFISDNAKSFMATMSEGMEATGLESVQAMAQSIVDQSIHPVYSQNYSENVKAMAQEVVNQINTNKQAYNIQQMQIAGKGSETVGATNTMGLGPQSGEIGKVSTNPAGLIAGNIADKRAPQLDAISKADAEAKAEADKKAAKMRSESLAQAQAEAQAKKASILSEQSRMQQGQISTTPTTTDPIASQQTISDVDKMNAAMSTNQPSLGPPGTAATGQDAAAGISSTGAKGIQGIQSGGMSGGNGGATCFIAGTLVMMADGTKKKIEDIKIGETLLGQDNSHNKVIKYDHPMLDKRQLISINNSKPFMTPEHPIYTRDGWKSYRLSDTIRENPAMKDEMSGQFNVGDEILNVDGVWIEIKTIEVFDNEPQQQLYNFILDGSNTYYADGFLVHNKGIICTELERQGLVSTEIWKDMVGAGGLFPQVVLDGYHLWARPVVRRMKKSDSFSRKIETLAKPVVYQIAAFNGGCGKWSVTGLSMLAVGMPICAVLGAAMLPFKQKNTNLVLGDK